MPEKINLLKAIRDSKKITQAEMAEVVGVTHSSYCQKERGNREFTLSEAKKISDLFNKTIEEIFFT